MKLEKKIEFKFKENGKDRERQIEKKKGKQTDRQRI